MLTFLAGAAQLEPEQAVLFGVLQAFRERGRRDGEPEAGLGHPFRESCGARGDGADLDEGLAAVWVRETAESLNNMSKIRALE